MCGGCGEETNQQKGTFMSLALESARQNIALHMDKILQNFKKDAKITVLVRSPGHPDRDFLMTNDAIPDAIEALGRREKEGQAA